MRNVLFMRPTLEIGRKIEAKLRQEPKQEVCLKVFLAGRIAVEAEGVVIDEQHFPGRQGRLLFAYLVAQHGRLVPRDELADVLWGDAPPATWEKALSVLVSKLRGVLTESGVDGATALTAAFGCYQLELPEGTWIDVLAAGSAAAEAEGFLEMGEFENATAAAALAESHTRSPFLPGDDGSWVEEKRRELDEVRARALSSLAEASLRTDRATEAVRWAGLAVEAEPFRETGYRRLMEAHVAAGDRGEALRVYERCRLLLAEELGAYPSPETESIYRSLLEAPPSRVAVELADATSAPGTASLPVGRRNRSAFRMTVLFGLVALVAAGTAIVVAATRGNGSKTSSGVASSRVALVVPSSPAWGGDPSKAYEDAVTSEHTQDGVRTQTFHINLEKRGLSGLSKSARQSIGNSGLVLLGGQFVGAHFVHDFARHPQTRFVVLDPDPKRKRLYTAVTRNRNTSDVFFTEGSGAYMAGFLSALMANKGSSGKRPVISMIGISKAVDVNVRGMFLAGAKKAVSRVKVLMRSSHDFLHPSKCAAIASHQIESGSRVVYADAGGCSPGALTVVEEHRGVWGVEGDQAPSTNVGSQIFGYTVKNYGQEVDYVIQNYVNHTLSPCHHVDIGIEVHAVDFQAVTNLVPQRFLDMLAAARNDQMPIWRRWANRRCK
jgi:DNA-binding SARP family transcriptional activator/basic membrane lipoprotein Med (substrate-binding protein (PBP1-ABC) superfamily)